MTHFANIPNPSEGGNPAILKMCNAITKCGWEFISLNQLTIFSIIKEKQNIDWIFIHWPQMMYRGKGRVIPIIKFVYFIARIISLQMKGVKIVWVAHNVLPHESSCMILEPVFRRIFLEICDVVVGLSQCCKSGLESRLGSSGKVFFQSLHGNYGSWYKEHSVDNKFNFPESYKNKLKLLVFGFYRKNKGSEEFLDEFIESKIEGIVLIIAGKWPEALVEKYNCNNIFFINKFIPVGEVHNIISNSDWVALTYEDYTTSGVFALAITYKKPVLARWSKFACGEVATGLGVIYRPGKLKETLRQLKQGEGVDTKALLEEYNRRKWDKICKDLVRSLDTSIYKNDSVIIEEEK